MFTVTISPQASLTALQSPPRGSLEPGQGRASPRDAYERESQSAELARIEARLVSAHKRAVAEAQAPRARPPEPVNADEIRRRFEEEHGVTVLAGELQPFGSPPKAPAPEPVDHAGWVKAHRKEAMRMVPLLRFGEQRRVAQESRAAAEAEIVAEEARRRDAAAREQAELDRAWAELEARRVSAYAAAQAEIEAETEGRAQAQRAKQAELDREWKLLCSNDPETVLRTVSAALAGNDAPAAALGCAGDELLLALRFGHPSLVPERRADLTPTGKPTTKKRTKTEINELYLEAMSSHVLAAVSEALAAAPGIGTVACLVVREERPGRLSMLYAGRFHRSEAREWIEASYPSDFLERAPDSLLEIGGRTNEIRPLDLDDEPRLREALEQIAAGVSRVKA